MPNMNRTPATDAQLKTMDMYWRAANYLTACELYLLDNPIGQGSFKKFLASAASHFGAKSNRELIADLQGATVLVVTRVRQNKDKTQSYTDIVEMQVV